MPARKSATRTRKPASSELRIAALVDSGVLSVAPDGSVWRHVDCNGDTLDPPRRADVGPDGYYRRVAASIGRVSHQCPAHRLVWHVLVGPIPEGLVINHKDGRKGNNHPSNLEVVTPAENARHAWETGLTDTRGENNGNAKITAASAEWIREKAGPFYPVEWLAEDFGVSIWTIYDILSGRSWASAGGARIRMGRRRKNAVPRRNRARA